MPNFLGYDKHIEAAAEYAKKAEGDDKLAIAADHLFVAVGNQVLEKIPGRISVECDARLSYNKAETLKRAHRIINLFKERGVGKFIIFKSARNTSSDKQRILIKIASTWEGIQAAKELEQEGIHCNLTLLFS